MQCVSSSMRDILEVSFIWHMLQIQAIRNHISLHNCVSQHTPNDC